MKNVHGKTEDRKIEGTVDRISPEDVDTLVMGQEWSPLDTSDRHLLTSNRLDLVDVVFLQQGIKLAEEVVQHQHDLGRLQLRRHCSEILDVGKQDGDIIMVGGQIHHILPCEGQAV